MRPPNRRGGGGGAGEGWGRGGGWGEGVWGGGKREIIYLSLRKHISSLHFIFHRLTVVEGFFLSLDRGAHRENLHVALCDINRVFFLTFPVFGFHKTAGDTEDFATNGCN